MADQTLQHLSNKSSNAEIVAKSIRILAAIENCGCSHCVQLLKEALQHDK